MTDKEHEPFSVKQAIEQGFEDNKLIEISYTTFGAVILSKPKEVKKEDGEV